jgi:PQQ-dependent dehydrogenase (methanol/ethanol family)
VRIVLLAGCIVAGAAVAPAGAAPSARDWPTVGGDAGNSRHSPLARINVRNVARLGGAWVRELAANTRTPPVVVGGVLYINDALKVYAFDARTGAPLWEHVPARSTPARGGVAVANGKVFVTLVDTHVLALDARTGALLWTGYAGNIPKKDIDPNGSITIAGINFDPKVGFVSSAPTYVNGKLIVGITGGDIGVRGRVAALNAEDGSLAWEWWVLPPPGEPGADTWPDDFDVRALGGGAVWMHGAADPQLGLVYLGTGNASPVIGGEVRRGDNLYMASIVALDVATGKLKWHYQLTRHDIWEMDVATPPILYDYKVGGRTRKAIAVMRTDGYLFAFDRATGEPLVPIEDRPVPQDLRLYTAATQPFPAGAEQFGPNCAEPEITPPGFKSGCFFEPLFYDKQGIAVAYINVRQAPMSFDPHTGYFYVAGGATPWWYRRLENPYLLFAQRPPGAKEYGLVAALDSRTHRIVWQKRSPWALMGGSGVMTTAGGLLFRLEGDGNFLAFDSKSGEQLWKFQTGYTSGPTMVSLTGGSPSATYEIDGEQYIAVPMGKGLWAFKLDGTLKERPAPPRPPNEVGFEGAIELLGPDDEIAIAALQPQRGPFTATREPKSGSQPVPAGTEHYVVEASFSPTRAQIPAGQALRITNYGVKTHTVVSEDGSWTTGALAPGQSATVTIAKPGTYVYYATEFPWARGQLLVR